MNGDRIVTGLTALHAGGLACVEYVRVPDIPVCRSATGSQVFACVGCCPYDARRETRDGDLKATSETSVETDETSSTGDGTVAVGRLAVVSDEARPVAEPTAEQRMRATT
jgi:hypothetical protein